MGEMYFDPSRGMGSIVELVKPSSYEMALEMAKTGSKPEGVPIELADVIIRVADMCGRYGIDLEAALRIKQVFNRTRPRKHGGKAI